MTTTQPSDAMAFILRFRSAVTGALPPGATAAIVSHGDEALVALEHAEAWHFPRTEDGVYAGYHPANSEVAIAHLEDLREKGAQYLIVPAPSSWWLDHYVGFRKHLERMYVVALSVPDTCEIFALASSGDAGGRNAQMPPHVRRLRASDDVTPAMFDDLGALFDLEYYRGQAGDFPSVGAALDHYLQRGFASGFSPNPLFDPRHYARQYFGAADTDANPLLHFLAHSTTNHQDPNPFFDTAFYYSQDSSLQNDGVNALVHYVRHAANGGALRPNPLFDNAYYLAQCMQTAGERNGALAGFLRTGAAAGPFGSEVHRTMMQRLVGPPRLFRGQWRGRPVLLCADGHTRADAGAVLELAAALEQRLQVPALVLLASRAGLGFDQPAHPGIVVLEDFENDCAVFRPTALRMLARSMSALRPQFALATSPDLVDALVAEGVSTLFMPASDADAWDHATLRRALEHATRTLFTSVDRFHAVGSFLGYYPARVAACHTEGVSVDEVVERLLTLARVDAGVVEDGAAIQAKRSAPSTRRVLVPCADWNVSGVNSALEAVGKQLIRLGWDVELVFTASNGDVSPEALFAGHTPELPYRVLPVAGAPEDKWEALLALLESSAPCLVLMAYDFVANAVAPALTDKVGVVAWAQSDDADYYEQTYRLGRYCNAVVCVSEHIQQRITALNPAIGAHARVIHNTSVSENEVVERLPHCGDRLRLIYTGRLVQYQKRILDVVDIANELERLGVPFEITLAGAFQPRGSIEDLFRARARAHLDAGRITLAGRLGRQDILAALDTHDFFLLLSDFEGLPLSLVEAMARGCVPVVAAMDSGIPEVVTDGVNGLIIEGRDYAQWAARIAATWRDQALTQSLSAGAQRAVREHFTIERVGRQFDALLTEVAGDICAGRYQRPASLNWGRERSTTGDVLPPPSLLRLSRG